MSENNPRPPEIAREALRRLALKRMAPTPDNFRSYYHEIAGTPPDDPFPEKSLRQIANALPRDSSERLRLAQQFEQAIKSHQWATVKLAILALCDAKPGNQPSWGHLIRELLEQLQRSHDDTKLAHKRVALDQVLTASSASSEVLYLRLQALLRGWLRNDPQPTVPPTPKLDHPTPAADAPAHINTDSLHGEVPATPSAIATGTEPGPDAPTVSLCTLIATLLRRGVAPMVADNAELVRDTWALADAFETFGADPSHDDLDVRVHALREKLEWAADDQGAVRQALLSLLQLIVNNISELVIDDNWLRGQLGLLTEVFSGPLDIRMLDEVERRLRDVIDKQGHLKRQLTDAQERLKSMLVGFVDRLAGFSSSTGHYHDTLVRCAQQIEQAPDISAITTVVEEMLQETRAVQETARRSSEELDALREEVESANHHIARLQRELDETSELVRHDPLTGALNRKGLDEALKREIARTRRRGLPLCMALLDIDNFKQLNDTFGHRTGDEALRHLTTVMRESLRPQDLVGRYGGEEFLILLPETDAQHSAEIIARLQRELTKRFFLAENQRLLITFSAGVVCLDPEEDPYNAIDRADKAMYAAKRAGKNRVLLAR